jgi:ankyrin repeat protein
MNAAVATTFDLVKTGDIENLKKRLAADPTQASAKNEQGLSLLMFARYQFKMDAVEAILAASPTLDLFEAAALGKVERLRTLLDADSAVVNSFSPDGMTPLGLACFFGQPDAARLLLSRGANVNTTSRNAMKVAPIHAAVAGKNAEVIDLILSSGADVNAKQQQGWTAIHSAAMHGDLALLEKLLARGADQLVKSDDGKTPMDLAREKGHEQIVTRLEALR